MPKRSSKKPRLSDPNQLAFAIVQGITGERPIDAPVVLSINDGKNPAAVALGRLGGAKGGKARAASLTSKRRKEIAKNAATVRWQKEAKETSKKSR